MKKKIPPKIGRTFCGREKWEQEVLDILDGKSEARQG